MARAAAFAASDGRHLRCRTALPNRRGPGRADAAAVATTVIEHAPWPLSLKASADTIVEGSVRLISALRAEPLSFDLIVRTHRGFPRTRPRLGSVVLCHSRDVAPSAGTSARAQSGPGAPDRRRRGLRLAGGADTFALAIMTTPYT